MALVIGVMGACMLDNLQDLLSVFCITYKYQKQKLPVNLQSLTTVVKFLTDASTFVHFRSHLIYFPHYQDG